VAPGVIEDGVTAYRECFPPQSGSPAWTVLCLPIVSQPGRRGALVVPQRAASLPGPAADGRRSDAEPEWSTSEWYLVVMLAAGVVGFDATVESLQEVRRRLTPEEVMARTDLPHTSAGLAATMRVYDRESVGAHVRGSVAAEGRCELRP
jgi:hypothetical protein